MLLQGVFGAIRCWIAPHGVDQRRNRHHTIRLQRERCKHRTLARPGDRDVFAVDRYIERAEHPCIEPPHGRQGSQTMCAHRKAERAIRGCEYRTPYALARSTEYEVERAS